MNQPKYFLFAGVVACGFFAAIASAQTLSLELLSYNLDYTVTVNTTGAPSANVYDTMQTLAVTDQSGTNFADTLYAFCVELGMGSPQGVAAPFTVLPDASAVNVQAGPDNRGLLDTLAGLDADGPETGIGAVRAANLEKLYGYEFAGGYSPESLSIYNQAVFQLAVWQLSHSNSFTLGTGDPGFYFTNPSNASLLTDTQTLLTAVYDNECSIAPMNLVALHSDSYQDFLAPIPEPSTVAAFLGMAGLGLAAGRRCFPSGARLSSARSTPPGSRGATT